MLGMTVSGVSLLRLVWIALIAAIFASIIAVLVLPVASPSSRRANRDVELRSRLVFISINDQVAAFAKANDSIGMTTLFDRLAEDESLLAIGFCASQQQAMVASQKMPATLTCETIWPISGRTEATNSVDEPAAISVFPLRPDDKVGRL